MFEEEPIYTTGGAAAGAAALVAIFVASSRISASKKVAILTGVAVAAPLVAAHFGRNYVAPLGPNREQAGEGHPRSYADVDETWSPDGGGGPDAPPDQEEVRVDYDDGR